MRPGAALKGAMACRHGTGAQLGPRAPGRRELNLRGLGQAYIDRLEPFGSFLKIELNRLTLFERAESVHLDGGVVYEDISPTIRLRDEAEALLGVEPLDCSGSHGGIPLSSTRAVQAAPAHETSLGPPD
jgi:hypothetical protein